MKESGQIALSYVASHADRLGIDSGRKVSGRFHLHVPAGAIPKDGPSAGITMVTGGINADLRGLLCIHRKLIQQVDVAPSVTTCL